MRGGGGVRGIERGRGFCADADANLHEGDAPMAAWRGVPAKGIEPDAAKYIFSRRFSVDSVCPFSHVSGFRVREQALRSHQNRRLQCGSGFEVLKDGKIGLPKLGAGCALFYYFFRGECSPIW